MSRYRALGRALQVRPSGSDRDDRCGCAMGARFLAVALVAALAWYAWHWHSSTLSAWAIMLRVFLWSFLAATAGKAIGILRFRSRARGSERLAQGRTR